MFPSYLFVWVSQTGKLEDRIRQLKLFSRILNTFHPPWRQCSSTRDLIRFFRNNVSFEHLQLQWPVLCFLILKSLTSMAPFVLEGINFCLRCFKTIFLNWNFCTQKMICHVHYHCLYLASDVINQHSQHISVQEKNYLLPGCTISCAV